MNQKEPAVGSAAHRVDGNRFRRTDDAVTDETTTRFFADLLLPEKLTDGLSNAGTVRIFTIYFIKKKDTSKDTIFV